MDVEARQAAVKAGKTTPEMVITLPAFLRVLVRVAHIAIIKAGRIGENGQLIELSDLPSVSDALCRIIYRHVLPNAKRLEPIDDFKIDYALSAHDVYDVEDERVNKVFHQFAIKFASSAAVIGTGRCAEGCHQTLSPKP